ncbi:MAG: 50S ribosomal protein L11 methyltransferase [Deltaproteobacteria bacterium]|nr:50S ribosomal protein L11 methyltransferase [Deltaproteobacteria bacterium]
MTENWIEIEVKIPAEGVDLVCACLNDLGCGGVVVEEKDLDTFVPPSYELEADRDYHIKAYFPEPENVECWRVELEGHLQAMVSLVQGKSPVLLETRKVKDEAWAENWKQHFHSFRVGQHLVFKPTWEESRVEPGDIIINIDPGMAFGTGTHPTTRLCLESLDRILADGISAARVLDVGTGSGILAMAAAALGAQTVLGCDVDETACEVARRNVALNGLTDRIRISGRPLSEIDEQSDIVLANILAEENVRLAPELIRCLKKGGWLILSGILIEKEALIEKGFSSFPLTSATISRLEDWACFTFRKKD